MEISFYLDVEMMVEILFKANIMFLSETGELVNGGCDGYGLWRVF